ncbi:MAG TPA: YoaK family protein [Aldersonia sp.]
MTHDPERRARATLTAMLALTFVTGIVDAVGYLGLDRVFTGNMTGNIVVLGMGIAGGDDLPVLGPAMALAAFAAGAYAAGRILAGRNQVGPGWHPRVTVVLAVGGAVLLGLTVAAVLDVQRTGRWAEIVMAAVTAWVMGQQGVAARVVGVADVTTVVVTSTLVGLAGETWVRGGPGSRINRRILAIAAILLGAVVGASLLRVHIAVPYALASATTLLVAALGHLHLRGLHAPPASV